MHSEYENDVFSWDAENFDDPAINRRKAVRYRRGDVQAKLVRRNIFRVSKVFEVELRDISTRGAHIACQRKLAVNAAFLLRITFNSGECFDIEGKIIHQKTDDEGGGYGFKFKTCNDVLGDYLLDTQTDLVFKETKAS
jgi:hypothetical protein